MRIAWRTAPRTKGSPSRATTRRIRAASASSGSSAQRASVPVSIRVQSAALAISEPSSGASPQRPEASFSRNNASAVSGSGMRNSASAMHISATPSLGERP